MKKKLVFKVLTLSLLLFLAWSAWTASTVRAQTKPYYKGKTIRLVVGFTPGGFYDRYARFLARHWGKYIPGNPNFIVQNMPGAGSRIVANYIYNAAKPDGLTIGSIHPNLYFDQITGSSQAQYDWRKFTWIGSPEHPPSILYIRADSLLKTLDDVKNASKPPMCGATGKSTSGYTIPKVVEETIGIKFDVAVGYKGGRQIDLAVERGEVACRVGTMAAHFGREPFLSWHKKGFDNHLLHTGKKVNLDIYPDALDIPSIFDVAIKQKISDENMQFLTLVVSGNEFGRPYVAPPGMPQDRATILRNAFMSVFKNPKAIAEAKRLRMNPDPVEVKKLKAMAEEVIASPPVVVERFKKLIGQ